MYLREEFVNTVSKLKYLGQMEPLAEIEYLIICNYQKMGNLKNAS